MNATVVPFTVFVSVHTEGDTDEKVTTRPDEALALTGTGAALST